MLFYLLQTLRYEEHSDKSAVPGIDRKDLHDIRVAKAPKDEQQVIAQYLDEKDIELSETCQRIEDEIALIREYRERLVADVVTGKLDVRHIKISVPAEDLAVDEADDPEVEMESDDADVAEEVDADY